MAWGMEDPAGRAREDSALRHDPAWTGRGGAGRAKACW